MRLVRLARGLAASPGKVTGPLVLTPEGAIASASGGKAAILLRIETSAEDVEGMKVAAGIVTTRGGLTGDAAIVSRILGKPCVAGAVGVHVNYTEKTVTFAVEEGSRSMRKHVTRREGDILTIDGTEGAIYDG